MKILNEVSFQLKVILEILEENLLTISIFSNTIFILILQTAVYFFCTLPADTSFLLLLVFYLFESSFVEYWLCFKVRAAL